MGRSARQFETFVKNRRDVTHQDSVLGSFRPGERRLDGAHVQLKGRGKNGVVVRITPHALRFCVGLDKRYGPRFASRKV